MLLYDQDIIGAFSEIFGNLRKLSEKCSESFASRVQLDISRVSAANIELNTRR